MDTFKSKEELENAIKYYNNTNIIEKYGKVKNWDVSRITDMSWMFSYSKFDGDISNWDVSNVIDMSWMFSNSKFDGDISNWNVSNVTDMSYMFYYNNRFNKDISKWNVSNITYMSGMFNNCTILEEYKPKK
jgi:surface protein